MSHAHSASVSSNESGSSSGFSSVSVSFINSVGEKIRSDETTLKFILRAETHVSELSNAFASGNIDRNLERLSDVSKDIHPDAVLKAMLAHATGTNEDNSHTPRRYVACAIATAGQENNYEQLIELANTWVRYLFWPFKANKGDIRQLHSASEIATPTLRDTETLDLDGTRSRTGSFKDAVKERDGYRCVVTKAVDISQKPTQPPATVTEAAHIFKRAVAAGKRSENSLAEYATWDILRHFMALTENEVAELDANIDHLYNGITLDQTVHSYFDSFNCSLRPDPVHLNQYHFELFTVPPTSVQASQIDVISFEGYPPDVRPSRKLIQFHYSLAKVLHASGAGEVIELMMKRFFEEGSKQVSHECLNADDLTLYLSTENMSSTSLSQHSMAY